jgi:hypothetical protein
VSVKSKVSITVALAGAIVVTIGSNAATIRAAAFGKYISNSFWKYT